MINSNPDVWIQLGASVFRKRNIAQRVRGNLQVDNCLMKDILGWQPPVTFEEGNKRTVEADLKSH